MVKGFLIFLITAILVYWIIQYVASDPQWTNQDWASPFFFWNQPKQNNQMSGSSKTGYNGIAYIDEQRDQYPAYYVDKYDQMNGDSEKCVSLPKVHSTCVNKKLMETGGDMAQSIRECRAEGNFVGSGKTLYDSEHIRQRHGFYPYVPQYSTLKKSNEFPVNVSLNAPQQRVNLVPSDSYDNDYVSY